MERLLTGAKQGSDAAIAIADISSQTVNQDDSHHSPVQESCSGTASQHSNNDRRMHASWQAGNGIATSNSSSSAAEASQTGGASCTDLLFFGCRRFDQDYLYRDLLESWNRDNIIKLHTAFSREQVRALPLPVSILIGCF